MKKKDVKQKKKTYAHDNIIPSLKKLTLFRKSRPLESVKNSPFDEMFVMNRATTSFPRLSSPGIGPTCKL
jgi:hypothetical protein